VVLRAAAEIVCKVWTVLCDSVAQHRPHHIHHLRSSSQDHRPSTNSVQKTIHCNSTSNAPDDGCMRLKHVELRIHQQNYLLASSWHFTLFHEEDAWSNNPQENDFLSVFWNLIPVVIPTQMYHINLSLILDLSKNKLHWWGVSSV